MSRQNRGVYLLLDSSLPETKALNVFHTGKLIKNLKGR
jgi:hypothetical protein